MLSCISLHSREIQSSMSPGSETHTAHDIKHTRNTVNPLITPDVNTFLPNVISTVSVLFISTDHCIGVTGDVSD
ncbi:unnamed protein product, partial [Staurois parvus]